MKHLSFTPSFSRALALTAALLVICASSEAQTQPPSNPPVTSATPVPDPAAPLKREPRNWVPAGVKVEENIQIGTGGRPDRPIWINIAYPEAKQAKPMPAMLWVHGGAWAGGDPVPNKAMWLAAHGYFTATVGYRLVGEAKWPAPIEDCKLAVRWLRANAQKYNINPDQIACWGESAGGHLVCCLGTMDDPKLEGTGGYPDVSSKVQVVVDYCGPTDLARNFDEKEFIGWNLFPKGTPKTAPVVAEASPIYHVKPGNATFLLVHGDRDDKVSYEHQTLTFLEALKKANVPAELYTVKGGYHAMSQFAGKSATPEETALHHQVVLKFLNKQFNRE